MADIFPIPFDITTDAGKARATADQIDAEIRSAAAQLKRAYGRLRGLIYNNPLKLTSDAAYAAFESNSATGLSAAQLQELATIVKAVCNRYQPGTVADAVPEATITPPGAS